MSTQCNIKPLEFERYPVACRLLSTDVPSRPMSARRGYQIQPRRDFWESSQTAIPVIQRRPLFRSFMLKLSLDVGWMVVVWAWCGGDSALRVAAVIFGAAHLNTGCNPDWRYFLLANVAGVVYSRAYTITRKLMAQALLHTLAGLFPVMGPRQRPRGCRC